MNSKKKNLVIPLIIILITGILYILFAKGSILMLLLVSGIITTILLVQYKTGNTALMFLIGIGASLVFIGIIVALALLSKNNPIITKIMTFPY